MPSVCGLQGDCGPGELYGVLGSCGCGAYIWPDLAMLTTACAQLGIGGNEGAGCLVHLEFVSAALYMATVVNYVSVTM